MNPVVCDPSHIRRYNAPKRLPGRDNGTDAGVGTQTEVVTNRPETCCDFCGKPGAGLRRCANCKAVWYCSVECQEAKWSDHKRIRKPGGSGPRGAKKCQRGK